jgi:hypothetical protein
VYAQTPSHSSGRVSWRVALLAAKVCRSWRLHEFELRCRDTMRHILRNRDGHERSHTVIIESPFVFGKFRTTPGLAN